MCMEKEGDACRLKSTLHGNSSLLFFFPTTVPLK